MLEAGGLKAYMRSRMRTALRPKRENSRANSGPEQVDFGPERVDFGLEWSDFGPEWADLGPES